MAGAGAGVGSRRCQPWEARNGDSRLECRIAGEGREGRIGNRGMEIKCSINAITEKGISLKGNSGSGNETPSLTVVGIRKEILAVGGNAIKRAK